MNAEFDCQVETLVDKGYPEAAGMTPADFAHRVAPLRERVAGVASDSSPNRTPFVIVIATRLIGSDKTIQLVERRGETGFSVLDEEELQSFRAIDAVTMPHGLAYLATDVETGRDLRNVTPDRALEAIEGRGRSPLTIEEGIALVTHYPETVAKNGGFSLPGSRCGDRRVAALWISAGRPKLGWCWAGNPHTWLGSASCGGRIGA